MAVLGWWCRSDRLRSQMALAYFTLLFELAAHPPGRIAPMEPPQTGRSCHLRLVKAAYDLTFNKGAKVFSASF